MEVAIGFAVPVEADHVESPQVIYDPLNTGVYFPTEAGAYARITFENLDALRVSRGEYLPFIADQQEKEVYYWVSKVENSRWLRDRFDYENQHYGSAYQFGGNVEEMLTDFSHFIFCFHDEFVEAIAKGIWFETSEENLWGKPLQTGHPFLPLPEDDCTQLLESGLTCQVRKNPKPVAELAGDAKYCSQKLLEFVLESDGGTRANHTLLLLYRNGKLTSSLKDIMNRELLQVNGIAGLHDVESTIRAYLKEVSERRRRMGR